MRNRLALITLLTLATGAIAGANAAPPTFTVTSSLQGKNVLPLRTRWLAYPKPSSQTIREVDFLIDGKLRWVEKSAPYNYGSDDYHGHLGYLITTWLTPGNHSFTARAVDAAGHVATKSVTARVLPPPAPPAEVAGVWKRNVTANDIKKSGPEPPPPGAWKLVFDRVGAWHLDPFGSGLVNQYDVAGDVIHVYAPITISPRDVTIRKLGYKLSGGGIDCREDGPFGSYTWSVTGDELMLTAIKEGCPNRRAIWEGVWTRGT